MKVKHLLHCHLLLPAARLHSMMADDGVPALRQLLAWALPPDIETIDAEIWLCQQFGVQRQSDWPIAPLAARGDGLPAESGYWLRADPAHLLLLRDRIILADDDFVDLDRSEADALLDTLNRHFASDGITFFAPAPGRWYVRLGQPVNMQTTPRAMAVGKNVQSHMPQGPDARYWHRILNEMQMLLHEHPVNEAREQHGLAPVNSIWLAGGGVLPAVAVQPYASVWGCDALVNGLTPPMAAPVSAQDWLVQNPVAGEHLLLPDIDCDLEQDWFLPLRDALRRGAIECVTLHLTDLARISSFSIPRTRRWMFWRRPQPLD